MDDAPQDALTTEVITTARTWGFQPGNMGGAMRLDRREARAAASELVNNPSYRAALAQRLLDGTAGAMEALMWFYAHGKPREQTEDTGTSAFKGVSDDELRQRLAELAKTF